MNKKKLIGYTIFFVILTIVFLIAVFAGTNYWKSKLPVYNYVRPFSFTAENGQRFTEKDIEGKVCVVNYFFTTCKGICPRMNNNLRKIYDEFKNEPDFMIVSHTCDPETDSASRLLHYADSMQVDIHKWVFLTGRKDSLYRQARNSYLLDDPNNNLTNINEQFLHTQFFALVDRNRKVRGHEPVYDGLKEDEMKKLRDDIRTLLNEK